MKIQSLSVVVPKRGKCINSCKFCVSAMREDNFENMMDDNKPFYDLYQKDYLKRLEFARDNGCNTVMLTGDCEPQQNRQFLEKFGTLNSMIDKPFRWIEMQTTGVLLDEPYLRFLRNHVGISTISLSLSSFDNDENCSINMTPENYKVNIKSLCEKIKKYDFNLRLSLNLTSAFNDIDNEDLFRIAKNELKADQITFRVLYTSTNKPEEYTKQDKWIIENRVTEQRLATLKLFIEENAKPLEVLEFGATKYSLKGLGTVLDEDCMSKKVKDTYKYLILRPNCKLYSKWDDPASLIF